MSVVRILAGVLLFSAFGSPAARAQDRSYFVTYDHYLEEPGNLEIALNSTSGFPREGSGYFAPWLEIEYGVSGWWTTEFYVEGVTTRSLGSGFTGWRLENRFRPLAGEHAINPVLYVEYENINEASRIGKEIVGGGATGQEPVDGLLHEHAHELEAKLILSSALRGWNVSENFVFEKNLSEDEGVEFGYAVGVSRSLGGIARGQSCRVCAENFRLGLEAYGGLGSTTEATLADTRHFVAPVAAWQMTSRSSLKASVAFGLTDASERYLLRLGWAYEMPVGGR